MPEELRHGAATHVGSVRQVNEDSYLVADPVFLVADGMGGHHGGDVASRLVAEQFATLAGRTFTSREAAEAVNDALARTQQRIREYAEQQPDAHGSRWYAGTTVVLAVLVHDGGHAKWLLANLGDSRAYRVTEGEVEQVSVDHSLVQELVDAGRITADEAHTHPERHVVTRALGGPHLVEPDFFLLPVTTTPRVMLCSDGINGMIDDDRIAALLTSTGDPQHAADQLVEAALAAGGHDNATAVVVDVVGLDTIASHDAASASPHQEQELGALP